MPDPALLPVEIFDAIIYHTTTNIVFDDHRIDYRFAEEVRFKTKQLAGFCLLSRRWRECSIPYLYASFECHGYTNSFTRFWHFLHTMETCPDLRSLVKNLNIRDVGETVDLNQKPEASQESNEKFIARCEQAKVYGDRAQSLGVATVKIRQALRKENIAPIQTLLQSYLLNLESVHVTMKEADQRSLVFDRLFTNPQLWSRLTEATFYMTPQPYYRRINSFSYCISTIAPLLELPTIKKFSAIQADLDCWSSTGYRNYRCAKYNTQSHKNKVCPQGDNSRIQKRSSSATHLVATVDENAATDGILHFLEAPRALVSLSLGFSNDLGRSFHDVVDNIKLWQLLYGHRSTLEYLDLYKPNKRGKRSSQVHIVPRLGSLKEFVHLRRLYIQPAQILGTYENQCPDIRIGPSQYRLKDVLPSSLAFLGLYRAGQYENIMRYWDQVGELSDQPSFPDLRAVITNYDRGPVETLGESNLDKLFRVYSISRALMPCGGLNHMSQPSSQILNEDAEYKGRDITWALSTNMQTGGTSF